MTHRQAQVPHPTMVPAESDPAPDDEIRAADDATPREEVASATTWRMNRRHRVRRWMTD